MMNIVYIFVVFLVTSLLLAPPLFPFWKVWHRVKYHHPDLWAAKGPFTVMDFVTGTGVLRSFLDIVALADKDEELQRRDPELVKWARLAREVWKMMPRSFLWQIGYVLIFLYFVAFFTGLIMGLIYN